MSARPRIALIHATPVAIAPIQAAFAESWPDAEPVNLLDESLSPDRAKVREPTALLDERMWDLAAYGRKIGAEAILFTCSAFGTSIAKVASEMDCPVLKPNEAMFEAAIARGRNCGMIVSFHAAVESMNQEFEDEAGRLDPEAHLTSVLVPHALDALKGGDEATHNRLVVDQARKMAGYDALLLAHFSMSRAAKAVREAVDMPVLTSPDAAVAKLKGLVLGR